MKKIRFIFCLLILLLSNFAVPLTAVAQTLPNQTKIAQPIKLETSAKSAIVVDANNGQILGQKNPNEHLPIASISKLMTAYLTLRAIDQKRLKLTDRVKITQNIAELSTNPDYTNVPLTAGQSYSINYLLDSTLIHSANAAALALDLKVCGSMKNFSKQATQISKQLKMKNTQWINGVGLENKSLGSDRNQKADGNDETTSSAKDLAILASHLYRDFPQIIKTTQQQQPAKQIFNQTLTHKKYSFIGLKSGSSDTAGANVITMISDNKQHRLINVALHTTADYQDLTERYQTSAKQMDTILDKWQAVKLPRRTLKGFVRLTQTQIKKQAVTAQSKTFWVKSHPQQLTVKLNKHYWNHTTKVTRPGQIIGKADVQSLTGGQFLPTDQPTINLITQTHSKKASRLTVIWRELWH